MVPLRCRVTIVSLPGATRVAPGRPPTPSIDQIRGFIHSFTWPPTHGAVGAPGDAPGRGKTHTGVYLWTHWGGYIPTLRSRGYWESSGARRD